MKTNRKFKKILLILIIFSFLSPIQETIAEPMTNQRLIPFIGMVVDYNLNIRIDESLLPIIANWTVTWEQYNSSTPSIFISNLTVKSLYMIPITLMDHESGIIVENITSRQVVFVDLANTTFLQMLSDVYFPTDKPNFSPFYISTTGISIKDLIRIYSFNMTVVAAVRIPVADFGYRDVWVVQVNATEQNVRHIISLFYDNTTGVLVRGILSTRWSWADGSSRSYKVEIFLRYTNALTRHEVIIEANRILILVICCVPIIFTFPKLLRMKEIKGGL